MEWMACDANNNCKKVVWDPRSVDGKVMVIERSVGAGGINQRKDVLEVQKALNKVAPAQGGADPKLKEDSWIGPKTTGAITRFQQVQFPGWKPDGRVDPFQKTQLRINELIAQTSPEQIALAFHVAGDALARVRKAIARLTAVRSQYGLSQPLFDTPGERRLVEWHFKVNKASDPVEQIDAVRAIYDRMSQTLNKSLGKSTKFRLFMPGHHPDPTAIAYAHWGGFHFAPDETEDGEPGRYVYITPAFRTESSSVIIHELGHYCGGRKGSGEEIGHRASPRPAPRGSRKEDGNADYAGMTPKDARLNVYSYQIYCFPEFPEHKPPEKA